MSKAALSLKVEKPVRRRGMLAHLSLAFRFY